MTLTARLDKSGLRVVCGMIDCGKDIARVVDAEYLFRKDELVRRAVAFPPGWFPQGGTALTPEEEATEIYSKARGIDGVWQLTRRNLRRERRGASKPPNALSRPQDRSGYGYNLETNGLAPWDLPVNAKCSACGSVQVIDPDKLQVSRHPSYRSMTVGAGMRPVKPTRPTSLGAPVDWE